MDSSFQCRRVAVPVTFAQMRELLNLPEDVTIVCVKEQPLSNGFMIVLQSETLPLVDGQYPAVRLQFVASSIGAGDKPAHHCVTASVQLPHVSDPIRCSCCFYIIGSQFGCQCQKDSICSRCGRCPAHIPNTSHCRCTSTLRCGED